MRGNLGTTGKVGRKTRYDPFFSHSHVFFVCVSFLRSFSTRFLSALDERRSHVWLPLRPTVGGGTPTERERAMGLLSGVGDWVALGGSEGEAKQQGAGGGF